jgi:hypothetical protein
MKFIRSTSIALLVLSTAPAFAQSGTKMTGDQLVDLTANGVVLKLGGDGEGYSGTLELQPDGTAKGGATTDGGDKIQIVGTWEIQGNKFCRVWTKLDGGNEVCETWYLTSGRSVEVFNGKKRLGVNSW